MIARALPHTIDPLIAEAKRRTRQRRRLLLVAAVLVAVTALGTTLSLRHPAVAGRPDRRSTNGPGLVLGSFHFLGRGFIRPTPGSGWGTSRPTRISNGGDSTGTVWHLNWKQWGSPIAIGFGLSGNLAPATARGRLLGWYTERVELRASDLGRCTPSGPVAYRKLDERRPVHRGGPLGPWHRWWKTGTTLCNSPWDH